MESEVRKTIRCIITIRKKHDKDNHNRETLRTTSLRKNPMGLCNTTNRMQLESERPEQSEMFRTGDGRRVRRGVGRAEEAWI